MRKVALFQSIRLSSKSFFYKNLLVMMIAVLGIAMAPAMSQASGVPLNSSGIYSTMADDGSKIFLYRYAPYTTGTPAVPHQRHAGSDLYGYLHEYEPVPFHHSRPK